METTHKSTDELLAEIENLKIQLEEANDTIEAIRTGQVDALIVKSDNGHELYTLKSADQTYRVFIEKMTEGAVTLNRDGIIVYSNSQFGKMVGLPLSKITGIFFSSFISPGDENTYEDLISRGWTEDSKGEVLLSSATKVIPVQLSITTLELDEGTSLSIILTDLTPQKQTQLLLKANNEKLQQMNHELELSNHDLQQFASVASHDLQEPLRKIQIFSNFLKERFATDLTQEASAYLDKIISSSQRMKVLIIDILSYSQLSQEDNSYVFTDLNVLINEVLEDYEILLKEKKASIIVDPLPSIEVNPGQMRQVFQNIISNALKFIRKDTPPYIRISANPGVDGNEPATNNESFCYLSFKDNGIGFDDKFARTIFTLFRRLHTKDKFEGTGIGLAISKKIIEKHRGNIIAKGQEGVGSEFIIVLPTRQNTF
ncbi:MAG: ATP-binding protein [Ferruginibacter sp.]|nr:ATP-binding protein [Ferruginibacter sp.]